MSGENWIVYIGQINCNLRNEMMCYNFRFKGLGIYPFQGKKIICPVLCYIVPTVFVLILTTKKKEKKTYSLGIHFVIL